MTVVDRFERLPSWGDLESIYVVRRIFGASFVLAAVRNPDIGVLFMKRREHYASVEVISGGVLGGAFRDN